MIDRARLLADCQAQAKLLVESLRERLDGPEGGGEGGLRAGLVGEHRRAAEVGRTGESFVAWLEERLEQVAASWVLACVFVRFLEDNDLVEVPRLSGPGERLARARDEETLYFRRHPSHSARELLEDVFREAAQLPGLAALLGDGGGRGGGAALWTLGPTGDGARALLELWRRRDPATGVLVHDFTDPARDTRFLGDLYQDLSAFARKRYALLQTPEFVEQFLLDRTLEPALEDFGLEATTLIDPACGSGHFLLGAFERLLRRWQVREPGTPPAALAQRALDALAGVDVNPFAVAIARFRLLVAALGACGVRRLAKAPAFAVDLAAGDSLLHGPRPDDPGRTGTLSLPGLDPEAHHYAAEDPEALRRILGRRYAVVVANPPYIVPQDPGANALYRKRFGACHMKYSLAVPFKERCFDLVRWQTDGPEPGGGPGGAARSPAGYVGMITANSFMKREFGKKLIEEFFPRWDLTHVLDTSGAYIPGHGTPTVILLARGRRPRQFEPTVRAVRGIRGEPSTPADPAQGQVWSAILAQLDRPGSQSEFVSVDDTPRSTFHKHPWSLGGGGAAELKERLEAACERRLGDVADSIGITSFTLEDDLFLLPARAARRHGLVERDWRLMITGDAIRDWTVGECDVAVFPYDEMLEPIGPVPFEGRQRYLWLGRTSLASNKMFGGKTKVESGLRWYEFGRLTADKLRTPLSITFAFVATHNHFVLDRGGRVFKQSAPVIKLPAEADEDEHLALLGLLNSSAACFWMKQACYPKGSLRNELIVDEGRPEGNRYEFSSTALLPMPVPAATQLATVLQLGRALDRLAAAKAGLEAEAVLRREGLALEELETALSTAEAAFERAHRRMIALQEELDWELYRVFGLTDQGADAAVLADEDLGCEPGDRPAFWTDDRQPEHLAPALRAVYARRRAELRANPEVRLIETVVYKRPWFGRQGIFGHQNSTYATRMADALRAWLLDRLETPRFWPEPPALRSTAQLADLVRQDPDFLRVAEVYRGRLDFDVTALVTELVEAEAVPAQAACRYKPSGLRKRAAWEATWALQRQEDAVDARTTLPVGDPARLTPTEAEDEKRRTVGEGGKVPVPPRYDAGDFVSQVFWRHRGKLDVPKERFVLVVGAERDADPTPVVAWAGYDHLATAQAIAGWYVERKEQDGWPTERLVPLLVALHELVPWLRQWHNAFDPAFGLGLGDYFAGFVDEEARAHGLTPADLAAWTPPKRARKAAGAAKPKAPRAPKPPKEPKREGKRRGRPRKAAPEDEAPAAGDAGDEGRADPAGPASGEAASAEAPAPAKKRPGRKPRQPVEATAGEDEA